MNLRISYPSIFLTKTPQQLKIQKIEDIHQNSQTSTDM
jgi:hypothetical protein